MFWGAPILSSSIATVGFNIRVVLTVGCYRLVINTRLLILYKNCKKVNVSKFWHINPDLLSLSKILYNWKIGGLSQLKNLTSTSNFLFF